MASHSLQWTHTSQGVITTGTLTNTYTVTTTDTTTTVSGSVTLKVNVNNNIYVGLTCKATANSCTVTVGGTTKSFGNKTASFTTTSASTGSASVSVGSYTVTINKTHSSQNVNIVLSYGSSSANYGGGSTNYNRSSETDTISVAAKPSYTISYNANGGSSTPGNQTKWYGESITLPSAITRTNYLFAGWKWNNSGTAYAAGSSWNGANAAGTFYASWEYKYTKPSIGTLTAYRTSDTASGGVYPAQDDGTNANVSVSVTAGKVKSTAGGTSSATGTTVKFYYKAHSDSSYTLFDTQTISANDTLSSHLSATLNTEIQYDIKVDAYVTASTSDSVTRNTFVSTATFLVDMTNTGIAFGQASTASEFECNLPTTFRNGVRFEHATTNTNTYYTAVRTDTNVAVGFGIGEGGVNHGIWSWPLSNWLIYTDGTNTKFYDATAQTYANFRKTPEAITIFSGHNYKATSTNWEYIGKSFTVPNDSVYLVRLNCGWQSGKPIGLGIHTANALDSAGYPNMANYENSSGVSNTPTFLLYPATYYVFAKRASIPSSANVHAAYAVQIFR